MSEELQQIQQLVGQLASKITELDYEWYQIFSKIMHQTPLVIVEALVSHRASTGEAQRQLILAVASKIFPPKSAALKFLSQANKSTAEVVARRNDAIHSIIFSGLFHPKIQAIAVARHSKLGGKDIRAELRDCLNEAERFASIFLFR